MEMTPEQALQLLDLSRPFSDTELKKAYRLALHAWHTDKFPEGEMRAKANAKTQLINQAYGLLKDATRYEEKPIEETNATGNQAKAGSPPQQSTPPPPSSTDTPRCDLPHWVQVIICMLCMAVAFGIGMVVPLLGLIALFGLPLLCNKLGWIK